MSDQGFLPARVERRNAIFQQWQALLTNRSKRSRRSELLVQGVRPITQALAYGHQVRALLLDRREHQSDWARDIIATSAAPVVEVAPELMGELGERDGGTPELLAVVGMPADDLSRIQVDQSALIVVFDRPAGPGNIGSLVRSVDALGGSALITTGHSADAWDPASVRASTGSIFEIPVVRCASHQEVMTWVDSHRLAGTSLTVIGTDEQGTVDLPAAQLDGPTIVVIGSETAGMSAGWRSSCDQIASIPMSGRASSLNAAAAGSVVLYEATRQRR